MASLEFSANEYIDPNLILNQFPASVRKLVTQVSREGFALSLVGGSVRDFLMTGKLGQDFDFELAHIFSYEPQQWLSLVERLKNQLTNVYGYELEHLSFEVIRIKLEKDLKVEIAPARLEKYEKGQLVYDHSDFTVDLLSKVDYKNSFRRRDFKINAMGIEFGALGTKEEFRFIDPFNGVSDLRDKLLSPCSEDFIKDPVRFCRAIRFSLIFNYGFSSSLKTKFNEFNLSRLSVYHFIQEALKSGTFSYFQTFYNLIKEFEIECSNEILKINISSQFNGEILANSQEELFEELIFKYSINRENCEALAKSLTVKNQKLIAFIQLKEAFIEIGQYTQEQISEQISDHSESAEKFLSIALLNSFLKFEKLQNWITSFSEELLEQDNSSMAHGYTILKLYFSGDLEGKNEFTQLIKSKKYKREQFNQLKIYCHLKQMLKTRKILP